ncbi:DUF6428 family protein [Dyadobacter sp. Leaf189]|uniref:DUF6428 family protein n=1 Tax=Dyadobacter sp. Leaf189 TaxID=1736295 RepID=UPI0006FECF5F|nr:DUF6428 family protein [Dyadobacter sp. Leaf189]KQS33851.1 hypothetical protein ASG33_07355 [Dyadobacter sp. Leaf189]
MSQSDQELQAPVTWGNFKKILEQNPDLHLQFQYAEGKFVDSSYHITEIKQAPIVSVDCGGQMNSWTEVIVQLWEPSVKEAERSMKVGKALKIVNLVEKTLPLNPNATVKIEFGNSRFDTRQMYPGEFRVDNETFTVNLVPDFTQCKALSRNQSCGTSSTDTSCCGPAPVKEELKLVENESASCRPGSGCC